MKNLFLSTVLAATSLVAFNNDSSAQAWNGKGDSKLQIGLSAWGYGTGIVGTYDYGIAQHVSLGVGAHFYFNTNKDYANFSAFGRANLHLNSLLDLPKELDIYPGLDLGINGGNGLYVAGHLGIRYFFTPKVGIFGEFGNVGGIGLSFNL